MGDDDFCQAGPLQAFTNPLSHFTSKSEMFPWLEMTLTTTITIQAVEITNRADCCGENLRNLEVRAGLDEIAGTAGERLDVNEVCGVLDGPGATGARYRVECSLNQQTDHVTLQILEQAELQVAKVVLITGQEKYIKH